MTERHPLKPFLPKGAKILMLGSFPPPMKRWKMPFYYPNFQNDMWRIFGIVFFNDINHFIDTDKKTFKQDEIVDFLTINGVAIYDTAVEIERALHEFAEVVRARDIAEKPRGGEVMLRVARFAQAADYGVRTDVDVHSRDEDAGAGDKR